GRRGVSSASEPISTTSGSVRSTCSFSNRFAGLQDAPRPRIAAWLCAVSTITGLNFLFVGTVLSSHEHISMSRSYSIVGQPLRLPTQKRASGSACPTILFYAGPVADCADDGKIKRQLSRRGGSAVDCAGLENRKAARPREFESHPLRVLICDF